MSFFIDWRQNRQLQSIDQATDRIDSKAQRATEAVTHLQTEVERLQLLTHAMWSLLSEKLGVTEQALIERVREIDLSDGVLDGKRKQSAAVPCPGCNRPNNRRHTRCMYCGAELPPSLP